MHSPEPQKPYADGQPGGKGQGRLLLVYWRSADWPRLHREIDAGRMPNLAALILRGTITGLASQPPMTRECLAMALATGCWADRHGVLAPVQARADGGGVEGAGRQSLRVPALWDLLASNGVRTACVNWPASNPADRAAGLCVDDQFATASGDDYDHWAMPPHSVSGPALAATLAGLRVHPADDLDSHLAAFAPAALAAARRGDAAAAKRLAVLRAVLARAVTVHAAATHLAEHAAWDACFVCYDLLHDTLLAFAGADSRFADVTPQAFALLDMMLGRLVALAGDGATVMLASPNGVIVRPDGSARPLPRGMLAAAGPGIAPDAILPGALVVDVAPTVLARFGLSAPTDGRVLDALAPADGVMRAAATPPAPAADAWDPAEALLAEGYRDVLAPSQAAALREAEHLRLLHLGIALMSRGALADAATVLESVRDQHPADEVALRRLARCRARMGEYAACKPLGEALLAIDPGRPWGHLVMATWAALGAGDPGLAEPHLARARLLGAAEPSVLTRLGGLELLRGQARQAKADFDAAVALDEYAAEAAYGAGLARFRLDEREAAESWLRRAIALEHQQPLAHAHLGALLGARGRHADAVAALATARAQSHGDEEIASMLARAQQALAAQIVGA